MRAASTACGPYPVWAHLHSGSRLTPPGQLIKKRIAPLGTACSSLPNLCLNGLHLRCGLNHRETLMRQEPRKWPGEGGHLNSGAVIWSMEVTSFSNAMHGRQLRSTTARVIVAATPSSGGRRHCRALGTSGARRGRGDSGAGALSPR